MNVNIYSSGHRIPEDWKCITQDQLARVLTNENYTRQSRGSYAIWYVRVSNGLAIALEWCSRPSDLSGIPYVCPELYSRLHGPIQAPDVSEQLNPSPTPHIAT